MAADFMRTSGCSISLDEVTFFEAVLWWKELLFTGEVDIF
jgi:hypothetical protein